MKKYRSSVKRKYKEKLDGKIRTENTITEIKNSALGEGNGTPLQYSCLENPMDGEAW